MFRNIIFSFLFFSTFSFSQTIQENHTNAKQEILSPVDAVILGIVEGITEYLPISSTGHLVIASELLGLNNSSRFSEEQIDAMKAFEIVIQAGAILAVLILYFSRVVEMIQGLLGKNPRGKKLLINVVIAILPTLVLGPFVHKLVKTHLQSMGPVILALIIGGAIMIRWSKTSFSQRSRASGFGIESLTPSFAFFIGMLQCFAMWPGTSRSMVTLLGGMAIGLSPVAAAEFSFLLGLPTLLAATLYQCLKEGHILVTHIGTLQISLGLIVAAIVAAISVKWLVSYLNRHGLALFGWYRIIFGVVLALYYFRPV